MSQSASDQLNSDSLLATQRPRLRLLIEASVFALTVYVCTRCAFYRVFTTYNTFDDEGAMLITMLGMQRGYRLYDQVLAMYGPFGFWPKVALLNILHITINHDVNRAVTWIIYVAGCLVTGVGVWRLTGRISLMVVSVTTSCIILRRLCGEPGHPGDICQLLLACSLLAVTCVGGKHSTGTLVMLGIIGGLLLMTKVNLGVFYIAALGTTCVWQQELKPIWNLCRWITCGFMLLIPLFILKPHLEVEAVLKFGITYELAMIAIFVIALGRNARQPVTLIQLVASVGATIASVLVIAFGTLLSGSTVHGMADGLIYFPLRGSGLFHWWWRATSLMFTTGFASLVAAVLCRFRRSTGRHKTGRRNTGSLSDFRRSFPLFLSFLQIGGGIYLVKVALFDGFVGQEILEAIAPAFVWLMLLPGDLSERETVSFPRLFLALCGLSQTLGGYPNAGTQQSVGLLLPMAAVVIGMNDGMNSLSAYVDANVWRVARRSFGPIMAAAIFCFGFKTIDEDREMYASLTPLNLPGSQMIHLDAPAAAALESVVDMLKLNCNSFMTLPGMNSFYLWTGILPPTWTNTTSWMNLTREQQHDNFAALNLATRPAVLFDANVAHFWHPSPQAPLDEPILPLVASSYRPAIQIGEWLLFLPDSSTSFTARTAPGKQEQVHLPAMRRQPGSLPAESSIP